VASAIVAVRGSEAYASVPIDCTPASALSPSRAAPREVAGRPDRRLRRYVMVAGLRCRSSTAPEPSR
jgi:hypothetical protein